MGVDLHEHTRPPCKPMDGGGTVPTIQYSTAPSRSNSLSGHACDCAFPSKPVPVVHRLRGPNLKPTPENHHPPPTSITN